MRGTFLSLVYSELVYSTHTLLFSQQKGKEVTPDFWKDMVAAIDHNYNTSAFRGMQII